MFNRSSDFPVPSTPQNSMTSPGCSSALQKSGKFRSPKLSFAPRRENNWIPVSQLNYRWCEHSTCSSFTLSIELRQFNNSTRIVRIRPMHIKPMIIDDIRHDQTWEADSDSAIAPQIRMHTCARSSAPPTTGHFDSTSRKKGTFFKGVWGVTMSVELGVSQEALVGFWFCLLAVRVVVMHGPMPACWFSPQRLSMGPRTYM